MRKFLFVGVLALAPFAEAQQPANPWVKDLRANLSRADYLTGVMKKFDVTDGKGQITSADLALREKAQRARYRASVIAMAMRSDLNSDNRVTRAELQAAESVGVELRGEEILKRFDLNADGAVDFKEINMHVAQKYKVDPSTEWLGELMATPEGIDGVLGREEVSAMAERTFAAADTNQDGWIDRAELSVARPSPPVTRFTPRLLE